MNILVIGFGSIGRKHVRLLSEDDKNHIWLFRSHKGNVVNTGFPHIYSWEECKKIHFDAAFITNPTSLHINTVLRVIKHIGCPIFIEKPLGDKVKHLHELLSLVKTHAIPTYVGYCLRFHPVIKICKTYMEKHVFVSMRVTASSYLPTWHPGSDWKKSYSSQKAMGGGVLLDLSHEFDYVMYLLGDIQKMQGSFSRISDITLDTEDVADVICYTKKGRASVHIDFLSHRLERSVVIDFKDMTVYGDLLHGIIEEWKEGVCTKKYTLPVNMDDVYREQLAYFLKNRNNPTMMNSISEAALLLKKILALKKKKI